MRMQNPLNILFTYELWEAIFLSRWDFTAAFAKFRGDKGETQGFVNTRLGLRRDDFAAAAQALSR